MDMATFSRLVPVLQKTKLAYLQGWGEPLMNPELFSMIRLAKSLGCQVGTTTNGMAVDRHVADKLIESGVDLLAFSLAGTGQNNDAIRVGTRFAKVLEAIRLVTARKHAAGAVTPTIHIAYMLMRSNLEDLEGLDAVLEGSGVEKVQVSTLDFVAERRLKNETVVPATVKAYDDLCAWLEERQNAFAASAIEMNYQLSFPGMKGDICTEKITRSFFVSAAGSISPCVYTGLSLDGASCIRNGEEVTYPSRVFGNICQQPVEQIWRSKRFKRFRRRFTAGKHDQFCLSCPKLYGL